MRGMRGIWVGLILGPAVAIACGDGDEIDDGPPPMCEPSVEAMGGDRGLVPDPTGCDVAVVRAAERGISSSKLVVDEEELAGKGFDLASSLCPSNWAEERRPGTSVETFYVRAAKAGGLELVTSTAAGGDLKLQVTPLQRSNQGYDAWNVNTCARLDDAFEDTRETTRSSVEAMHLVFWRTSTNAPLRARVAVADPRGPIASDASFDATAASARVISVGGLVQGVDNFNAGLSRRNFVFSEPVSGDSEVTVTDQDGGAIDVTYVTTDDYKLGFEIDDAVLTAQIELRLVDLAGNATTAMLSQPVVELDAITGDFETKPDLLDPINWPELPGYTEGEDCKVPGVGATPADVFDGVSVNTPALEGNSSFLFGSEFSTCSVGFRMTRPAAATQIAFDARSIGSAHDNSHPSIELCVSSLAAGGDKSCATQEIAWEADPEFSTAARPVSVPHTLIFPLPESGSDMLVTISTPLPLWLDSLRME